MTPLSSCENNVGEHVLLLSTVKGEERRESCTLVTFLKRILFVIRILDVCVNCHLWLYLPPLISLDKEKENENELAIIWLFHLDALLEYSFYVPCDIFKSQIRIRHWWLLLFERICFLTARFFRMWFFTWSHFFSTLCFFLSLFFFFLSLCSFYFP